MSSTNLDGAGRFDPGLGITEGLAVPPNPEAVAALWRLAEITRELPWNSGPVATELLPTAIGSFVISLTPPAGEVSERYKIQQIDDKDGQRRPMVLYVIDETRIRSYLGDPIPGFEHLTLDSVLGALENAKGIQRTADA